MGADARTGAMGMAGTALAGGSAAGFWNPAGLLERPGSDVLFSWHRWIQGVKSGAFGLSWTGKKQGIGFHLLYAEAGGIEHRIVPSPEPIGTFSWSEFAGGLSYARQWRRFCLGASAKILYEKVFVDDAWGWTVDLGAVYAVRQNGLRIAAAALNIGKTEILRTERIELPFTAKIGAAVPVQFGGFDWTAVLDGVLERSESFHLHGGIEWSLVQKLHIRAGYQTGYDNRNFTFGTGITWSRYRFDYGYMPFQSGLGDSHWLTFRMGS